MRTPLNCLLIMAFCLPFIKTAHGQPDFGRLDLHAMNTPAGHERDIPTLVNYLTAPAGSQLDIARVIFTWVASRISYDDVSYNAGMQRDDSPGSVLQSRSAVCEGFSNLFHELCRAAGLESAVVRGYSKGYGHVAGQTFQQTNHAWNALRIDGQWRLFDVTWASGYGTSSDGKLVTVKEFEPFWFDVHPKAFIFTHLPADPFWQLAEKPVSMELFVSFPYLSEDFFKLGFNAENVYRDAISGKVRDFVEVFSQQVPCTSIQLPYAYYLEKGRKTKFIIASEEAAEIALIDGNHWHKFSRDGNRFTLYHAPTGKQVVICAKKSANDKACALIVKYSTQK